LLTAWSRALRAFSDELQTKLVACGAKTVLRGSGIMSAGHRPTVVFGLIILFFVLIGLLRELHTPDLLSRLQALGPDLLLRGALTSSDPNDSEMSSILAVVNFDLVSNLQLAS
jgi:hypothetical protein